MSNLERNVLTFPVQEVLYVPSYKVTDAYFAKKIYKRSRELSKKTHLYEMNTTRKTTFEKNEKVIEIIAHNTTQELYCQADEIMTQLDAIPLQSGYIMQGTPVDVQIYTKNTTPVGNVVYKFKHTNLATHQTDRDAIAKQIQRNIQQALHVDRQDVQQALDATPNKKFAAGATLQNIAVHYNHTPIGTTHYTFKHNNDLTYKPSQARKETIEYIVNAVNKHYTHKYETTYEQVDAILPEEVKGKKEGSQQTKLNVPLYALKEKYKKITTAALQEKVHILLKTEAPIGHKHTVQIYEKEPLLTDAQQFLPISNNTVCSVFEKEDGIIAKTVTLEEESPLVNQTLAIAELTLNPNSETLLKEWREKLKPKEGHKQITDKIYLRVDEKDEFLKGDEFELRAFGCKINVNKFIEEYKKTYTLKQEVTENIKSILTSIQNYYNDESKKCNIKYIAYMLATIKHETANTFQPIDEYGGEKWYEKMYDPTLGENEKRRKMAKQNGNTTKGDGVKYHGRGFVQLTWKNNYNLMKKALGIDFVKYPEKALELENATKIMIYGMEHGSFTGKKLADYINAERTDYLRARYIINGVDKRVKIEGYAKDMENFLRKSI